MIPHVPFRVSPDVMAMTLEAFRKTGRRGYECFVLWFGRQSDAGIDVVHAEVPRQRSTHVSQGCHVHVSGEELFRMSTVAADLGLMIVAQAHAHPEESYHSQVDDERPLVGLPGALSLVVPDFGAEPIDIDRWSLFRLLGRDRWEELDARAWLELGSTQ